MTEEERRDVQKYHQVLAITRDNFGSGSVDASGFAKGDFTIYVRNHSFFPVRIFPLENRVDVTCETFHERALHFAESCEKETGSLFTLREMY